jgi:hypothetical protein
VREDTQDGLFERLLPPRADEVLDRGDRARDLAVAAIPAVDDVTVPAEVRVDLDHVVPAVIPRGAVFEMRRGASSVGG